MNRERLAYFLFFLFFFSNKPSSAYTLTPGLENSSARSFLKQREQQQNSPFHWHVCCIWALLRCLSVQKSSVAVMTENPFANGANLKIPFKLGRPTTLHLTPRFSRQMKITLRLRVRLTVRRNAAHLQSAYMQQEKVTVSEDTISVTFTFTVILSWPS